MSGVTRGAPLDRVMRPVHQWVWGDVDRRLRKLLTFADVETDGGRDILRAAEITPYRELVGDDPRTRAIFEEILRDEVFHMNYTYKQLTRISPQAYRRHVWQARAKRLWNRYLRVAAAIAGLMGSALLIGMYFVLLPPFAWLAKRGERREPIGWVPISPARSTASRSQY